MSYCGIYDRDSTSNHLRADRLHTEHDIRTSQIASKARPKFRLHVLQEPTRLLFVEVVKVRALCDGFPVVHAGTPSLYFHLQTKADSLDAAVSKRLC